MVTGRTVLAYIPVKLFPNDGGDGVLNISYRTICIRESKLETIRYIHASVDFE